MFFFAATRASDSTQLASNASAPTDRSQLASNAPAPTTASNPAKRHHVPSHTMPALTGQMVSFLSDKPWYSPAKYHNFLRLVNLAPFSCTPIGPIGTQLRLVHAKWAVAVEVALGSVLESFVVDSHADGNVLKVRSSCIKSLLHLPHHHLPIPHRKSAFRNLYNDDEHFPAHDELGMCRTSLAQESVFACSDMLLLHVPGLTTALLAVALHSTQACSLTAASARLHLMSYLVLCSLCAFSQWLYKPAHHMLVYLFDRAWCSK